MKKKCVRRWQSAEGYVPEIIGSILAVALIASCSAIFWPVIERWAMVRAAFIEASRLI